MVKKSKTSAKKPVRQPAASETARLERQAEALRANLHRRKDQSRARQTPDQEC